jgi:hypothetical protein
MDTPESAIEGIFRLDAVEAEVNAPALPLGEPAPQEPTIN